MPMSVGDAHREQAARHVAQDRGQRRAEADPGTDEAGERQRRHHAQHREQHAQAGRHEGDDQQRQERARP